MVSRCQTRERLALTYKPPDPATFIARVAAEPCCAAITAGASVDSALASRTPVVVILRGNGLSLVPLVRRVHAAGKLVAVHIDLVSGVRQDHAGVAWLAAAGVDAVISSHGQLMASIRREGMTAIHRLLLVRRSQLDSAAQAISRAAPSIVEVLPGVLFPSIVDRLPPFKVPVLAGGFIRTEGDVRAVMDAGALGVTTSAIKLWGDGGD